MIDDEMRPSVAIEVNGRRVERTVESRRLLVHFLRDAGLHGVRVGCDTTSCGACTVLLDGRAVKSCTLFAVQADGRSITTVEGLGSPDALHPVQEAFMEEHGLQCGYCTSGISHGDARAAEAQPRPDTGGDQGRRGRQPVPVHRLHEHRPGRSPRGTDDGSMSFTGKPIRRIEDPAILTGVTAFVDDIDRPGLLHAGVVRSTEARATIAGIDTSEATALPGVVGVFTASDLGAANGPIPHPTWFPPNELLRNQIEVTARPEHLHLLAPGRVRYVGEPIALVVADDPYTVADAVPLVVVDYEPQPAVATIDDASQGSAGKRVNDEWPDNEAARFVTRKGDVATAFAGADVVVEGSFRMGRQTGTPLEPRGVLADPTGEPFTVWSSNQAPHWLRDAVSQVLALDHDDLRVVAPDGRRRFRHQVDGLPGGAGHPARRSAAGPAGEVDRDPHGELPCVDPVARSAPRHRASRSGRTARSSASGTGTWSMPVRRTSRRSSCRTTPRPTSRAATGSRRWRSSACAF